jgi:hypothetical protein
MRKLWSCWWNTAVYVAAVGGLMACLPAYWVWPPVVVAVVGVGVNVWASLDMRRVYAARAKEAPCPKK